MKDNRGRVKWAGILLALALVVAGCSDLFVETPAFDNPQDPKNRPFDYAIGDVGPAGGWVFYLDANDQHAWTYLEAAPVVTEWIDKPWGGYDILVGTGTVIGAGTNNTIAIVARFGTNEPSDNRDDYAARIVTNLMYNGYDDWFLPSIDELGLMNTNLRIMGVGDFASEIYFSSSEHDSIGAYAQHFGDTGFRHDGKHSFARVRAVRAFGPGYETHLATFDSQGGTSVASQRIASGGTATLPTPPEKAGFMFLGWFDADAGGTVWDFNAEVTKDITLFAQWAYAEYNLREVGPAGGFIFYDNPDWIDDGWRYLEAAPNDISDGGNPAYVVWSNVTSIEVGTTLTGIGTGQVNTLAIIDQDGHTESAAQSSVAYNANGYDDWFLPSRDELNLMYDNLHFASIGSFALEVYWSSSEFDASSAWTQDFSDNTQLPFGKDFGGGLRVRAVRAF